MHHENFDVFGARKMHIVLNREADTRGRGHVARCTIERLMRDLGLRGIRRAKEPNTTRSAPRQQCPQDLVNRHFRAFAQNQLWVADIVRHEALFDRVEVRDLHRCAVAAA